MNYSALPRWISHVKTFCRCTLIATTLCFPIATQAQTKHYLVSVAKLADSWLRGADETYFVPNEITTAFIDIDTNLELKVTTQPTWAKITQDTIGRLCVNIKSINTGTTARRGTVTVKAKDNRSINFYLKQYSDKAQDIYVSKKECVFCADELSDKIIIQSNKPFTISTPDWLTATKGADDTFAFQAQRVYDEHYLSGNIDIKDATGTTLKSIPVKNYATSSLWAKMPVFAVISDIHVGDDKNQGWQKRLPRLLKSLSSYPELKTIFVVGDIANNTASCYADNKAHTEEEYKNVKKYFHDASLLRQDIQVVFMRGNHDLLYSSTSKPMFDKYIDPTDNHYLIIDGYPFITSGVDNSSFHGEGTDPETLEWVKQRIIDACHDYPGKPIFVFQHVEPQNTLPHTHENDGNSYIAGLDEMLSEFPQVIDFCGHSHYCVLDPRLIYQKYYTVINDGSGKNDSHPTQSPTNKQLNAKSEPDYDGLTEALIVHFNEAGEVVIERWNTTRNLQYSDNWVISPPFESTAKYRYTEERTGGKNPWWPEGASIKFSNLTSTSCNITFPHAIDDAEGINRYIIKVYCNGTKVQTINQTSLLYMGNECPKVMTIPLTGLAQGSNVQVKVYARDYYELESPELIANTVLP